ncbi:hypothetical protein BJX64DRAFT_9870 [Aspergillus heterothallicus]
MAIEPPVSVPMIGSLISWIFLNGPDRLIRGSETLLLYHAVLNFFVPVSLITHNFKLAVRDRLPPLALGSIGKTRQHKAAKTSLLIHLSTSIHLLYISGASRVVLLTFFSSCTSCIFRLRSVCMTFFAPRIAAEGHCRNYYFASLTVEQPDSLSIAVHGFRYCVVFLPHFGDVGKTC